MPMPDAPDAGRGLGAPRGEAPPAGAGGAGALGGEALLPALIEEAMPDDAELDPMRPGAPEESPGLLLADLEMAALEAAQGEADRPIGALDLQQPLDPAEERQIQRMPRRPGTDLPFPRDDGADQLLDPGPVLEGHEGIDHLFEQGRIGGEHDGTSCPGEQPGNRTGPAQPADRDGEKSLRAPMPMPTTGAGDRRRQGGKRPRPGPGARCS